MKKAVIFLGMVALTALLLAGAVQATVTGYVSNPSGNSVDWTNAIGGLSGTVNSAVNFNTHPVGSLQSNFYSRIGVTLTPSGDVNTVQFGAGPGQGNTSTPPLSTGEGLHPASNYLFDGGNASTLTIDFANPVLGAGLFVIDYFNPTNTNPLTLAAYTGSGGTGTLLGSFSSAAFNFQNNYMYFMGIVSTAVTSVPWFSPTSYSSGDTIGIDDLRFATAATPYPCRPRFGFWGPGSWAW